MAKQTDVGAALRRDKPTHNRGVKPLLHSMHSNFRRVRRTKTVVKDPDPVEGLRLYVDATAGRVGDHPPSLIYAVTSRSPLKSVIKKCLLPLGIFTHHQKRNWFSGHGGMAQSSLPSCNMTHPVYHCRFSLLAITPNILP